MHQGVHFRLACSVWHLITTQQAGTGAACSQSPHPADWVPLLVPVKLMRRFWLTLHSPLDVSCYCGAAVMLPCSCAKVVHLLVHLRRSRGCSSRGKGLRLDSSALPPSLYGRCTPVRACCLMQHVTPQNSALLVQAALEHACSRHACMLYEARTA